MSPPSCPIQLEPNPSDYHMFYEWDDENYYSPKMIRDSGLNLKKDHYPVDCDLTRMLSQLVSRCVVDDISYYYIDFISEGIDAIYFMKDDKYCIIEVIQDIDSVLETGLKYFDLFMQGCE